jgi:hypothetical protein
MSAVVENDPQKINNKIFRFKFSNEIIELLTYFAELHRFDNRVDYKEAWKKWYKENLELLNKEEDRIINLGYKGNIEDKMYKSARYYFRKKTNRENNDLNQESNRDDQESNRDDQESNRDNQVKTASKKTRRYISLTANLLILMDKHIKSNINNNDYSPASGYDNFCKKNAVPLAAEHLLLENNHNLSKTDILCKIKKTYKNRYYLIKSI